MASRAELGIEAAPQVRASGFNASPPSSPAAARTAEIPPTSYDVGEFVREVPAELQCAGCRRIPSEPRQTQCCFQTYCQMCLTAHERRQAERIREVGPRTGADPLGVAAAPAQRICCPYCSADEREFSFRINAALRREISSLDVLCQNRPCGWSGVLSARHEHDTQSCDHALVHCPDCASGMLRLNLASHKREDCRFRETRCKHCSKEGRYAEIVGLDSAEVKHNCPMVQVPCPNKCNKKGSKNIRRGELPEHFRVCPLQSIDCQFKAVGCDAELIRKNYDLHMKTAQQQHLLLLLSAMQTKLTAVGREIDFLTKSVQDPGTLSSLACMKSHVTPGRLSLDGIGDEVTFRVKNFTHLEQYSNEDGKWESPAFYFLSSYRMHLSIYPGGRGARVGRFPSISLHMHKPEKLDSNRRALGWPIDCTYCALQISVLKQFDPHPTPSEAAPQPELAPTPSHTHRGITANICLLCNYETLAVPEGEVQPDMVEVKREDEFVTAQALAENGLVLQDSLVLRVEMTGCECVSHD